MKCKHCGKEIDNDSVFCKFCGAKVNLKCKYCGEEIANDSNFCKFCGKKVNCETVEQDPAGYVDLGLSVHWKSSNESGYYTYDDAVRSFGSRLPTHAQFTELRKCTWTWVGGGYRVTGPNGNSIFLPAAGFRYCDGNVNYVGTLGSYWSSTPNDSDDAWYLHFFSSEVLMSDDDRCRGRSVRLVQGK